MNTKFKFGDRVRVLKNSVYNQEIGVVTKIFNTPKPRYRVAFENDLDLTFSESELELIPYPDTARLDFIQEGQVEISTFGDERFVTYFFINDDMSNANESIRALIDHAMQQEQTK